MLIRPVPGLLVGQEQNNRPLEPCVTLENEYTLAFGDGYPRATGARPW